MIAVGGGYFGASTVKNRAARRWTSQVTGIAMPAICAHLGDLTHTPKGDDLSIDAMIEMKLIPKTDYRRRLNLLRGSRHGTRFSCVQAHMTNEDDAPRRDPVTDPAQFTGLLFQIGLPRPAPGRIALIRDRGRAGNTLAKALSFGGTRALPKVAISDPTLEQEFEVHAEIPDEAQAFLTDTMVKMLMRIGYELGEGQGLRSMTAGFDADTFYLAVRRAGTFQKPGDLFTPVTEIEADLHQIFDDIALAYHVVDRFNLAFAPPQTPDTSPAGA